MGRKKGIILSYVLMIAEVLSTLLLTPLIIRSLGQAEYGVYKLIASIITYLVLLDLGMGNAVIRYTAKYKKEKNIEKQEQFFGVAQLFYIVIAIIALMISIIIIWFFPNVFANGLSFEEIELGKKLLAIVSVNTAVTLATAVYSNLIIGYGYFAVSKGSSILQILVKIILTYIALKMGFKSIAIVTINLITTILCKSFFIYFVFFKLKLKPKIRGVNKTFVLNIIGYSSWILLQMIATQINAFADQIMLGILIPGAALVIAVYGIGSQIVQYFQSIASAIGSVLFPSIVTLVEDNVSSERLQAEMIKIGRFSLLVLLAVWGGFLIFGKQFISLWAGNEYLNSYYVAIILMVAYLFIHTESIGSQILWAKNEHKEQALLKILAVLINIFFTIILIKWNPVIGATIGTFISLIVGDVIVMNIIFKKKIGIDLVNYYKGLFNGLWISFSLTITLSFLFTFLKLNGWLGFIINIAFFCFTYVITIWNFGLNKYEKETIIASLHHLFLNRR